MRRPCSVLVLLLLLVFGVSVVVPTEDVPETPYDESEALSYEGTPLSSIALPQPSGRTAKAELSCGSPFRFNPSAKSSNRSHENYAESYCVFFWKRMPTTRSESRFWTGSSRTGEENDSVAARKAQHN
jgi:hypothetical protein